MDEEMRFHLESRVEHFVRSGLPAEEARRRAQIEFGSAENYKVSVRETRRVNWLEDLALDLRYGIRSLLRVPAFTTIAVLTLALGIGANTALFTVVKAVLLNSLPYYQPEQLVTLGVGDPSTPNPGTVAYAEVEDWKSRSKVFQSIALSQTWLPATSGNGKPEIVSGMRITQNFFDTLGIPPYVGRGILREEDRPGGDRVVLLSYGYWLRRYAGNPRVLGRVVLLNQVPYKIIGVLPESFQPLSLSDASTAPQIFAPLGYDVSLPEACRDCRHLRGLARLASGVPLTTARAEMQSVASALAREFPKDYAPDSIVAIKPLRESWYGKVQTALLLLLTATALVLLIACANVANLLLAHAEKKRREVAVRAALGASRYRIARQLLTESVLVGLVGGAFGLGLAVWGTAALVKWAPSQIPRLQDVHLDTTIFLVALVVSISSGVFMGLTPVLQALRVDQREAMQPTSRGAIGAVRDRTRNLLVASEVGLAFVLTIAAGLLIKSFLRATEVHPGFEIQNLYTLNFALIGPRYDGDKEVVRLQTEALERIRQVPGVEAAGIVSTLPIGGSFDQCGFQIQDRPIPGSQAPSVDRYLVSPGYFQAMGIPLLRGRFFTEADTADSDRVAIISELTARRMWPGQDPLGKHIQLGGRHESRPWAAVVGIVGDVHQYALDSPATPQAYMLYPHSPFDYAVLTVRSRVDRASLTRAIEAQLWSLDSTIPVFGASLMNEILSDSLAQRRFTMSLLAGFGALALLLAMIGIYGVMSYTVAQRTNEIGVRMALGAQQRDVMKLVTQKAALCIVPGLAVGLAVSVALNRMLSSELFGVSGLDPLTFGEVLVLLVTAALAACYVPARRAASVDPIVALRYE
jgi:putative ABC transport system permease protein